MEQVLFWSVSRVNLCKSKTTLTKFVKGFWRKIWLDQKDGSLSESDETKDPKPVIDNQRKTPKETKTEVQVEWKELFRFNRVRNFEEPGVTSFRLGLLFRQVQSNDTVSKPVRVSRETRRRRATDNVVQGPQSVT